MRFSFHIPVVFAMGLLGTAAPAQEIPLRGWMQVDAGQDPCHNAHWQSARQSVRVETTAPAAGEPVCRSFYVADSPNATDFAFRCAFTREAVQEGQSLAQADFGIVLRWNDAANYYALYFDGEDRVLLQRTTGGVAAEIASCPGYAPIAAVTYLDAQLAGAHIRIRLNGRPLIDVTDTAFSAGRVGFFAGPGVSIRFDDIALHDGGSAPFLYVPLLILKLPYVLWTDDDEAVIMWETNRPVSAEVTYGEIGQEDTHSVAAPADGCLQKVVLTGLTPNRRYGYRVKAEGRNRGGGEFYTRAAPGEPFTVGFIGGTRAYPEHFKQFAAMLLARQPNFVVHLGDIVDRTTRLDQWDELFFKPGEALFGRVPAYLAPGEHDASPNRHWFNAFLPYPGAGNERDNSGLSGYYAYPYGNAAFAILDTGFPLGPASPQARWLEETLRSPVFQNALWRIVCCHEPPYGIDRAQWKPGNADVRTCVLPLCREYGVQLLVCGHEETYKRTIIDGVILIVNGAGIAEQDPETRRPGRVAQFADQLFGYASLQYSVMHIKGFGLEWTCYNSDNKRIDRFRLEQGRTQPVATEQ